MSPIYPVYNTLKSVKLPFNSNNLVEPKPEDFNLPRNKAEGEAVLAKMKDCGIDDEKAIEIMRERIQKCIISGLFALSFGFSTERSKH